MKTLNWIVVATVLAVAPACKKQDAPKPTQGSGETLGSANGSGTAGTAGSAGSAGTAGTAGSAAMGSAATEPTADHIEVLGEHKKKKDTDPVVVHFDKFKVTKASFDPTKIEGGTASIEVDLTSLSSGSEKRDTHLKSDSYLDVGKLATMTIDIANVKKQADKTYTADATVKLAATEKKYPVTFDVVDAKDDWIRIKGEHKFPRADFHVGKPESDPDESVAAELTIKVGLTLKKT